MKKTDKVLFDRAKERIDASKLDDHSKEGISVALVMSGEACNGMNESEKMETLTRAVFSLTLAVSYFMAQAPEHTNKCINDAISGHVGSCAKLMAQKKPNGDSGSAISLSWKEGVKAKGMSAIIIAAIFAVLLSLYGITRWQDSRTRSAIKEMLDSKIQQIKTENALSQTNKQGDTL